MLAVLLLFKAFGSYVSLVTVTVLAIGVVLARLHPTPTVNVSVAVAFAARDDAEHCTRPPPSGPEQVQSTGPAMEVKTVPAGTWSDTTTARAASVSVFSTVIV